MRIRSGAFRAAAAEAAPPRRSFAGVIQDFAQERADVHVHRSSHSTKVGGASSRTTAIRVTRSCCSNAAAAVRACSIVGWRSQAPGTLQAVPRRTLTISLNMH